MKWQKQVSVGLNYGERGAFELRVPVEQTNSEIIN